VAADLAERLGRSSDAESHLEAALTLGPSDPFSLGLWADFLLTQGRAAEVRNRLESHQDKDALLLRYAEAKSALLGKGSLAVEPEISRLSAGFAAARRRGVSHAREEARFYLHLLGEPQPAIARAWENWEQQREPADVRLLLECGRAAHDSRAVDAAQAWVRTNRLEDVVFHRLASTP
jgi:hypothetical protein